MESSRRFYGKYRGTVVSPVDLGLKGRISATLTLGGTPFLVVAGACTPDAGPGVGFFAVPPVGAGVWIEFEEGDLDRPIWTGCWWAEGQLLTVLTPPGEPPPDPTTAATTVVL